MRNAVNRSSGVVRYPGLGVVKSIGVVPPNHGCERAPGAITGMSNRPRRVGVVFRGEVGLERVPWVPAVHSVIGLVPGTNQKHALSC